MAEFILVAHIEFSENACSKIRLSLDQIKFCCLLRLLCFSFQGMNISKKLVFFAKNNTFPFGDHDPIQLLKNKQKEEICYKYQHPHTSHQVVICVTCSFRAFIHPWKGKKQKLKGIKKKTRLDRKLEQRDNVKVALLPSLSPS